MRVRRAHRATDTRRSVPRPGTPAGVCAPAIAVELGEALHSETRRATSAPLWLYLVNEDARGRVYRLFPLAGTEPANPLPSGDLRLPGRINGVEQDWVVTSEGGTESFLLVASRLPLPELESALTELEDASGDRTPRKSAAFTDPTRGVGGLGASVEASDPGTLLALREIALAGSSDVIQIITLRGGTP